MTKVWGTKPDTIRGRSRRIDVPVREERLAMIMIKKENVYSVGDNPNHCDD